LFFISFPLPMLPPYLKVDFSDIPALIAGIIFSPIAGVLVILVKNGLYFVISWATDPVGVVANFLAGSVFIFPVAYCYHKMKSVKGVLLGLLLGTLAMTIVMSVLNYLFILPAYAVFLGVEMTPAVKLTTVAVGILPFNILTGIIISLLFVLLVIKFGDWIQSQRLKYI